MVCRKFSLRQRFLVSEENILHRSRYQCYTKQTAKSNIPQINRKSAATATTQQPCFERAYQQNLSIGMCIQIIDPVIPSQKCRKPECRNGHHGDDGIAFERRFERLCPIFHRRSPRFRQSRCSLSVHFLLR
jgi:hypothetical protein